MDVKCPRCHNSERRHRVADKSFATVEEFMKFYNKAKEELYQLSILD